MANRFQWLGHLQRMDDRRSPRLILYGWLLTPRAPHGVKLRSKDKVMRDLRALGINRNWQTLTYQIAMQRHVCSEGVWAVAMSKATEEDNAEDG